MDTLEYALEENTLARLELMSIPRVVKCLVPVSGGKDSQASLKLAIEEFGAENVRGLFCDTQFEHPLTYAHVRRISLLYGVHIDRVCGGSVESQTRKYRRWPGSGARHCTDWLKIRETRIYATTLARRQGCGFQVWYGMRSEESGERKRRYQAKVDTELYAPHEVMPRKYPKYMEKLGIYFRLPILDWSVLSVKRYVGIENLNPLYKFFDRVGCFPCMAANPTYKRRAFEFDDFGREQHRKVIMIARDINKDPFGKGEEFNENAEGGAGCTLCSM